MNGGSPIEPTCRCVYRAIAPAHHDRMLELERLSFRGIGELVGIAATWAEVDTSDGETLIDPADWLDFAECHEWIDRDAVIDLMVSLWSLATSGSRAVTTQRVRRDADVVPIVRSVRGGRRERTA